MKYSVIGSGEIGTAVARAFARKHVDVVIANSRGPQTIASLAQQLGPNVVPRSLADACEAEIVFLAVPFSAHKTVAGQLDDWKGKLIVDVTNAFHAAPDELDGRLSSDVVAEAFFGARLVKAFNHLPAAQLGSNAAPAQQVVFVSSNDADASATVAAVVTELGFVPVQLGRLDEGGVPLHVRGGEPGGLLFENLSKQPDVDDEGGN